MKKPVIKTGDLFSFLAVCGLWIYFRAEIIQKADTAFFSLFGKNLTGRNPVLQGIIFLTMFLLSVLVPVLLERMISKNQKFTRITDLLTLLTLAIPAVQLTIICANQVLRRDDYWEIADARAYGFPGSMFYEIRQWNGRYTGWGLRSLHAILPNIPYIDIFLLLNLVLLTAALTMLARRFLRSQQDRSGGKLLSLVIGLGLSLTFILMSSNIWEFWFWGSGTMIYGFGLTMCLLSTALILNLAEKPSVKAGKMLLPALTCFLTCGCSELCTASLAAFLFILLIWKRIETKKWDKTILFFFSEIIILLLCIFLMTGSVSYAGNRVHYENSEGSGALAYLLEWLRGNLAWAFSSLYAYTFIKPRELLTFLGTAFLIGTMLRFKRKDSIKYLLTALFLTIIGHCVLIINAVLNYMPPRVVTVGICWFTSALALLCLLAGSFFFGSRQKWNSRIKMIFCALLLCLAMNRFYSQNIDNVRSIRQSWFIRNALLEQYKDSEQSVKTCSLPSPGSSHEDILTDPGDEFNQAAARFYLIPAISAETRCPPYGETFLPEDRYRSDPD